MNSRDVIRRMTPEELEKLDNSIREAQRLIGNRRRRQEQIDFDDRRSGQERRDISKGLLPEEPADD